MDAVKKAASGAVDSIRNSPLFKRKFGNRTPSQSPTSSRRVEALSPEKDTTPFVQGVYFMVDYLGKQAVDSDGAQEHGCTDDAVAMLWKNSRDSPVAKHVTIKVTTTSLRIKEVTDRGDDSAILTDETSKIFYEFPLFRVSYCGTSNCIDEAFSFVAKDQDGRYYCFVFRCASKEKSHAMTLTVAKAFYLAYQILLEQQGNFPAGPDRETLFEPQRPDDTHEHPHRPDISPSTAPVNSQQQVVLEVADDTASPSEATPITTHVPSLRVLRPSQTSVESECLTIASADEDFTRLAKARSNPDILRSTLDAEDIKGGQLGWAEKLRLHADPGSTMHTPMGSTEQLNQVDMDNDDSS